MIKNPVIFTSGNRDVDVALQKCFDQLYKKNVEVLMCQSKYVQSNKIRTMGYFQEHPPKLVCSTQRPIQDWVRVFFHEFAHFKQWSNRTPIWIQADEAIDVLWAFLNGDPTVVPFGMFKRAVKTVQELELDCEKRAYRLLRRHHLFDLSDGYIRKANAYLFFYTVLKKEKRWYKHPPSECPEIVAMMPDRFLDDYSRLQKGWLEVFKRNVL